MRHQRSHKFFSVFCLAVAFEYSFICDNLAVKIVLLKLSWNVRADIINTKFSRDRSVSVSIATKCSRR